MNYCLPDNDEIEISLFGGGAGYGESLLIHYGNGKWLLIDSALNPNSKKPIIEEYLNKVDLSYNNITKIVATHWHNDHINGLADVYNLSHNATFYCSDAFNSNEFFRLYATYKDIELPNSGVSEITKIISSIDNRDDYHRTLKIDQMLLRESIFNDEVTIHSLSPSDYSCLIAKQELLNLMPMEGESVTGVRNIKPNQNCIVFLMSFKNENVLLAADIENTGDNRTGWNGILKQSNVIQGKKIKIYKVAHHGSEGAYNEEVWKNYLDNPISVLTPFARGKKNLPTSTAMLQIDKDSCCSFITSEPIQYKYKKRQHSTHKVIQTLKKDIYEYPFEYGHIRIRNKLNTTDGWRIELDGTANKLSLIDCFPNKV